MFGSSYELKDAFDILFQRPTKLMLTVGELHPTSRLLEDDVESTEMEGVEHLGQYVYEMTQAKVASLMESTGSTVPLLEPSTADGNGAMEIDDLAEDEHAISEEFEE